MYLSDLVNGEVAGCCDSGYELSDSIECRKFLY